MRRVLGAALLAVTCAACSLAGDPGWPLPYRPILSTDTATADPGTFEVQGGLAVDPGDGRSAPLGVFYGLDGVTELALCGLPAEVVEQGGGRERGVGDTTFTVRRRVWEDASGSSFAWQATLTAPTGNARRGLGIDGWTPTLAAVFSHDLGSTQVSAYHEFAWLDDPAGGVDGLQTLALLVGHALPERTGVYGEFAWLLGGDLGSPRLLTAGVTRDVHPTLVLDVGATWGFGGDAPETVLHVGFTWLPSATD